MIRLKEKRRIILLAGLCLALLMSGGCGSREQMADTEAPTENVGEADRTEGTEEEDEEETDYEQRLEQTISVLENTKCGVYRDMEYTCSVEEDYLLEAIKTQVILAEDTEIERYEWVDEEKTCFRIRVRYQEPPEQSYQHKEDYFFFLSDGTVTQVLYVDYPSKAEIYHDGLPDRYPMFACDFDAHLEDVTFDGNADLIISLGDSRWNSGSCAYVYENGVYRYEPTFEDISDYETDAEQKIIRGYIRSGAAFYTNSIYEYRDGKFVEREHHHYQQYYDDNGDLQEMEVD